VAVAEVFAAVVTAAVDAAAVALVAAAAGPEARLTGRGTDGAEEVELFKVRHAKRPRL
jgi:hypothetical protein